MAAESPAQFWARVPKRLRVTPLQGHLKLTGARVAQTYVSLYRAVVQTGDYGPLGGGDFVQGSGVQEHFDSFASYEEFARKIPGATTIDLPFAFGEIIRFKDSEREWRFDSLSTYESASDTGALVFKTSDNGRADERRITFMASFLNVQSYLDKMIAKIVAQIVLTPVDKGERVYRTAARVVDGDEQEIRWTVTETLPLAEALSGLPLPPESYNMDLLDFVLVEGQVHLGETSMLVLARKRK